MEIRSAVWYPTAVVITVINLLGIGYAAFTAEPMHAIVHGALAVGFGLLAQRLRQPREEREPERDVRLEVLEAEVGHLQRELSETREGLDFTERLLKQRPEPRPIDSQYAPPPAQPKREDEPGDNA